MAETPAPGGCGQAGLCRGPSGVASCSACRTRGVHPQAIVPNDLAGVPPRAARPGCPYRGPRSSQGVAGAMRLAGNTGRG